ncbi:outer-membrane lipoprotein carrier protein LolA [Sphingosinicella sp. YJ22]|uniref:LolA family protein n=1 Tax=Sphingosinicella sp. YJ22 TaxID=1104780 RepID=UPI001409725D|nr:outer-membrane lipoprotein carrier protein LolA [Sphingosinicella sp. YJ22]
MFLRALALTAAPLGLAATAALAPVPAVAQQNGLAEVQAHLRAITSMTANFSQTDARGRTLTGTLALKRPGKIRFEYRGVRMLVVADGTRLNFLDYEVGQQQSWPIGDSPLSVLLNPNRDLSQYARVIRNDGNTLMVEARDPRRREFGRITLAFARNAGTPGGLSLTGWNALDAQNNLTQVRLTGQRYNVPVADSLFRFEPARGRGPRR